MSTAIAPAPASSTAVTPPVVAGARDVVVIETLAEYAEALDAVRRSGRTVGVVPTMGALHAGHRSLVERAAEECDVVAVSIFVNPTQFGEAADLASYPRTLESDLEVVSGAGAHLVFAPSVTEMYPGWPATTTTTVSVPSLSCRWEGASRPGHFDGVSTVVAKLLSAAGRSRAYFGEKDFQQLAVVRRLVRDLSLPAEVVGCETVRDDDGLALSSRNVRLSTEQRRAALVLSRALRAGAWSLSRGECDPSAVEAQMARLVAGEPEVELDYAVVVHADDLEPARSCAASRPLRLLIAATVGPVRLIDNLGPHGAG
ncbi:MAG TPA: pantoate--beta-alanine ligase [Acidimicrobiales bacterium]